MKKSITFSLIIYFMTICYCYAGQVITTDIKSWAAKVIAQEKQLGKVTMPNSVAVLYFFNNTNDNTLNPLQKGMSLMLITDLAKVGSLNVIERIRIQAIIDELKLSISGLIQQETAPKIAKLLKAYWVVGGTINGDIELLDIKSNVLKVADNSIVGTPFVKGSLQELFKLEKDLLFKILQLLKVKPNQSELEELKKPLSTNIEALMALFKGIDASDKGQYDLAAQYYREAIKKDRQLQIAKDALTELKTLGLIQGRYTTHMLLKSLKAQTSLSDTLTPEYPIKRTRYPKDIAILQDNNVPANLPPDYGAETEPLRPENPPSDRPGIF